MLQSCINLSETQSCESMHLHLYTAWKNNRGRTRKAARCSHKQSCRQRIKSNAPSLWVNKLQVIVLCNEGSRAYCANALLFNDLIKEPHSNWSRKFQHGDEQRALPGEKKKPVLIAAAANRCASRFCPFPVLLKMSWTPKNAKCCLPKLNDLQPLSGIVSF